MASGKIASRKTDRPAPPPASYLALIRRFPLRPITSEVQLDQATAVMNSLLDRDDLDPAEADYLDVLGDLVERYEDVHHPVAIADLTAGAMLEHLLDAKVVSPPAVARATGIAEATLAEVLAGKRELTPTQISRLTAYFHVHPTVFPTRTATGTKSGARRKSRER